MNKATVLKSVTAVVGAGGRDLAHHQRAYFRHGKSRGDWRAGFSAAV